MLGRVKRIIFIVAASVLAAHGVIAQRTYGEVSMEEMLMKTYEPDSVAGAVILFDLGSLEPHSVTFTRHIRIKVLKKSGLDWGNWIFNTPSRGDFKVTVFNLVEGRIVKEKAGTNTIYREEVIQGYEQTKVFAPNVKVGSVIDIKYSFLGLPFEWWFQERIPVIYNELKVPTSNNVSYSKTSLGFEQIQIISQNEWRTTNVPAFKIEPYLNNYTNYITKFIIQIESFSRPGYYGYNGARTWDGVCISLLKREKFGQVITTSPFLNDFARTLKESNRTVDEKIREAYAYIQQNIKWNGTKSTFASYELRNNFVKDHSGTSADVNLLLIAVLNKSGITTHPVALSTRDNGLLLKYNPMIDKLNYVIGYVEHENVKMFLDATSEHLSPGMVPSYCLNGDALLVKKEGAQWVTPGGHTDSKKQFVNIVVKDDATAIAKISHEYRGYAFVNWMAGQKQLNFDVAACQNKLQKENANIQILRYAFADNGQESVEVDMSSQLIDAGDEMIFTPFVLFEYASNPLTAEDRRFPLDLFCPKEFVSTILVQLPKNFKVKERPQSMKLRNSDGSAIFTFLFSEVNGNLQIKAHVKLNKHIFTEVEYIELRNFFTQLVKTINTPIQIVKS